MKKYAFLLVVLVLIIGATLIIKKGQEDAKLYSTGQINAEASPTPEPSMPYTASEVSKHSSKSDCWIIISGSVFDMTSFIDSHPGGNAILQGCGKDATLLFNSVPNHNQAIKDFLRTFKIGIITQQNKN